MIYRYAMTDFRLPTFPRRRAAARLAAPLLATTLLAAVPATAPAALQEITSDGPLTSVVVGDNFGCQVAHRSDARLELFPSSAKPGDCGTFLAIGTDLYAPTPPAGSAAGGLGSRTPFTPVSQTPVTGSGTSASPFKVTTVASAGATGMRVTEVDQYIVGQESYRTDVTLQNTGGAPLSGVVYRAGDCYLQSSDTGYGFAETAVGAVGCSLTPNNSPANRIEEWYPITPGNQYMQARYSEVWTHIGTKQPFPNTTRATESIDNGAGISWTYNLPPGQSATFAHYTTFSPTGVTGPPRPPASTTPQSAFGPNGVVETPSNRRCISRRYFRIRVPKKYWPTVVGVTVRMPKTTRILRKKPWGTIVDLRGLPKGTFKVRITALTVTGKVIRGTRTYRTCRGKLTGGRPKL